MISRIVPISISSFVSPTIQNNAQRSTFIVRFITLLGQREVQTVRLAYTQRGGVFSDDPFVVKNPGMFLRRAIAMPSEVAGSLKSYLADSSINCYGFKDERASPVASHAHGYNLSPLSSYRRRRQRLR